MNALKIEGLTVEVEGKVVLQNFNLMVPQGEVHAIMGPNGTGKSTLSKALAGHEDYKITEGKVFLNGVNIVGLEPDEISRLGLFLAFQDPRAIPGVSIANFIRAAIRVRLEDEGEFEATVYYRELYSKMDELRIDRSFTSRSVNENFSGGEKKRLEILQMMMLKPQYAFIDEIDSGLDIDAIKIISDGINKMRGPEIGILMITHYQRILKYIVPDKVHVMSGGKIIKTGGKDLAIELEEKGYDWINDELVVKA